MRIYVAGPISNGGKFTNRKDQLPYVKKAVQAGMDILKKGHCPFIPHLTYFIADCNTDFEPSYEGYLEWDFAWLEVCDAILYLAPSTGADRELEYAKGRGLIVFKSVSEIPNIFGD